MSRSTRTRPRQQAEDERGSILIISALLMVPLLIFVGFAVDIGSFYARASRIQRAADAAALAGVVWMPDFDKAEDVALGTARRNGFVSGQDDITITVSPDPTSNRRLRVNIEDARAETYFASIVTDSIAIGRRAIAEYVLPVPLGSPTNHFGTGDLVNRITGGTNEYFWGAVNGYCTDKVDGDRVLSRYFGNKNPYSCSDATLENGEYRSAGYAYYVDVPPNRSQAITLAIYDAPYFNSAPAAVSPDLSLRNNSAIDTTFVLRGPDDTPYDDSNNPVFTGCGTANPRTFASGDASVFNYAFDPFNRTSPAYDRWTNFCTISTTAPAGRYILDVATVANQAESSGSNGYSLLARLGNNTFCDGRTDATCPRVYGKDDMSVLARSAGATGEFFLTEIDKVHKGKQMLIRLWDPGEGGNNIQILDPSNNVVNFTYSVDGGAFTTTPTNKLFVTNSQFNGKSIELLVSLASYAPPAANNWWKIRYKFDTGTVSDRTTWSVSIIGDPVHLVEER
jgi:hypothetical protein